MTRALRTLAGPLYALLPRSARRPALAALVGLTIAGCSKKIDVSWAEPPPDGTEVTCPVSGQRCTKGPSTPAAVVEERTYYFCTDDAPARFAAEPERFRTR